MKGSGESAIRLAYFDDQTLLREAFASLLTDSDSIQVVCSLVNNGNSAGALLGKQVSVSLVTFEHQLNDPLNTIRAIENLSSAIPLCALTVNPLAVHGALNAGCVGAISPDSGLDVLLAGLRAVSVGKSFVDPLLSGPLLAGEPWTRNLRYPVR